MEEQNMSYNKCVCMKCNSQYATMIQTDDDIQKEACPQCGENQLSISGPMSVSEVSGLFSGG
jgi:predicted RNA-binding Zn-ribbon protein involved in translation (DUF1610 family)